MFRLINFILLLHLLVMLAENRLTCSLLGSDSGGYVSRLFAQPIEAIGYKSVQKKAKRLNTYTSRREQKSCLWMSTRPQVRNDCAGEGQKRFN
jgi:hypothetical protein